MIIAAPQSEANARRGPEAPPSSREAEGASAPRDLLSPASRFLGEMT